MLARRLPVLVLLLVLAGCEGPQEINWISSDSPKGTRVLRVSYLEAWSFGPHTLLFHDSQKELTRRELKNDGKVLGDHNISLEWTDETSVRVTLRGEEQENETFVLSPGAKEV